MSDTPAPDPASFDPSKLPLIGGLFTSAKGMYENARDEVQNLSAGAEFLKDNPEIGKLVQEHPDLAKLADKDTPLIDKIKLGFEGLMDLLEDMIKPLMDSLKGAFGSLSQTLSGEAPAPPVQTPATDTTPAPAVTAPIPAHVLVEAANVGSNVPVLNGAGSSYAPGVKPQQEQLIRGH